MKCWTPLDDTWPAEIVNASRNILKDGLDTQATLVASLLDHMSKPLPDIERLEAYDR